MIYVASAPGQTARVEDIAYAYQLSRHHLLKVVQKLNSAGVLKTMRGRQGGVQLNQDPEKIRISDVVEVLENDFYIAECFRDKAECIISPECELTSILAKAKKAFLDVLAEYYLCDLLKRTNKLRALLSID